MTFVEAFLLVAALYYVIGRVPALWRDQAYLKAWLAWRIDRPVPGRIHDWPDFERALVSWRAIRPSRRDFARDGWR